MCLHPSEIIDPQTGVSQEVACRNCWQCRKNRLDDLVGRCIAETEYSLRTLVVTLTYAGDNPNSAVLVYRDFQLFIKRLRAAGYSVRYLVTGEYGTKKGRAHWHAILFFQDFGDDPYGIQELDHDKQMNWKAWPDGLCYFQEPDYRGYKYVLKYVLKDQTQQVRRTHLAMSKKPPLGDAYIREMADKWVALGNAPQDIFYSFKDIRNLKGKVLSFTLQGKSRENFFEHFIDRFRRVYPGRPLPESDVLTDHLDMMARREMKIEAIEKWEPRQVTYEDGTRYVECMFASADGSKPGVERLNCHKYLGTVTRKTGEIIRVAVYSWDDGQLTYVRKITERTAKQWHASDPREAERWLGRINIRVILRLGYLARPKQMPRIAITDPRRVI